MKNKKVLFIAIGIVLIAIIGVVCLLNFNKTEYRLNIPKEADSFTSITLEKNDEEITIETSDNIQSIMNMLNSSERITTEESIQDVPTNMEDEIKITFNDEKNTTIFIYEKNNKYYIEQAYNGIYKITKDEYNDIVSFYKGLKEEIKEIEVTSLNNRLKTLQAADWLGKSFKPSDLTNEELLRVGFEMFGPTKNSAFVSTTFAGLVRTYINGYFGREDAKPQDITCSCGKVIATYNSENDKYTWDDEYHYLAHKSNVYNDVLDMYKVEDKYIVKVYKIFSDVMMNSSTTEYNFYSTYNDAVNKENILFTVTNESEFTNALDSLDKSKKVLYTLTFTKNGTFKLVDYKIGL